MFLLPGFRLTPVKLPKAIISKSQQFAKSNGFRNGPSPAHSKEAKKTMNGDNFLRVIKIKFLINLIDLIILKNIQYPITNSQTSDICH